MSDSVDRDFNTDRPKTFRVRDQVFLIRTVKPETWAECLREAEDVENAPETELAAIFALSDKRILLSIDPVDGGHERWNELRRREGNGIELADLLAIRDWLTEVHTGRPTRQAELSSPGPGSNAVSSTVQSSSPEVIRV